VADHATSLIQGSTSTATSLTADAAAVSSAGFAAESWTSSVTVNLNRVVLFATGNSTSTAVGRKSGVSSLGVVTHSDTGTSNPTSVTLTSLAVYLLQGAKAQAAAATTSGRAYSGVTAAGVAIRMYGTGAVASLAASQVNLVAVDNASVAVFGDAVGSLSNSAASVLGFATLVDGCSSGCGVTQTFTNCSRRSAWHRQRT